MNPPTKLKTEREKVLALLDLIGERGLYVNSNYDIFPGTAKQVPIGNLGYNIQLLNSGERAYSSPLLFATLSSLMNHGTMMFTGGPGIGKTTAAECAGHFFSGVSLDEILQAEIIGNPQLKTEDLIASLDTVAMISKGEKIILPAEFLKCPVKIWDEINRTPADLLSVAMKLVDTGNASYQGVLLKSPPGMLFATQNYTDEGTFELTPPFLDRFDLVVVVTSPPAWDLRAIRARGDAKLNGNLDKLLEIPEDLKVDNAKIRQQIYSLSEETIGDFGAVSTFADFMYSSLRFSEIASDDLTRATKGNTPRLTHESAAGGHFNNGTHLASLNELTIRTVQAINRYSRAFAWFQGKDSVKVSDLKTIAPYLLWHKLQPSASELRDNTKFENDRIAFIKSLLTRIESEYLESTSSEAFKWYAQAMNVIHTGGKVENRQLSMSQLQNLVSNSIKKIGETDKAYSLIFAQHLSQAYNSLIMRTNNNDESEK